MARIAGVNIPDNKHVRVSLTYIYGVGNSLSIAVCNKLDISLDKKAVSYTHLTLPTKRIV